MTLIDVLNPTYTEIEILVADLLKIYERALDIILAEIDDCAWISIGYEQSFSIAYGYEGGEERFKLTALFEEDEVYYEKLQDIVSGRTDSPFFNSLLSSFIVPLEQRTKAKYASSLQAGFKMYVWTNEDQYFNDQVKVPDFEKKYGEEEIDELYKWTTNLSKSDKLRTYMCNMIKGDYKGQDLNELAKSYWQ